MSCLKMFHSELLVFSSSGLVDTRYGQVRFGPDLVGRGNRGGRGKYPRLLGHCRLERAGWQSQARGVHYLQGNRCLCQYKSC